MYSLGGGGRRRRTLQCASRLKAHTVLGEVAGQLGAADRELALGVQSLTLARAGFAGVDALLLAGALDVWVAVALRDVVDAVFVELHAHGVSRLRFCLGMGEKGEGRGETNIVCAGVYGADGGGRDGEYSCELHCWVSCMGNKGANEGFWERWRRKNGQSEDSQALIYHTRQ